jgi:hypothetical protein
VLARFLTAVVVLALVAVARPAVADLTPAEKADVRKVYEASRATNDAVAVLGEMMAELTPANLATIKTQALRAAAIQLKFAQGMGKLMGVDGGISGTFVASAFAKEIGPAAMTCPGCTLTSFKAGFTTLKSRTGCGGSSCGSAGFIDKATAAEGHVTAAMSKIASLNTALPYANAMPAYPQTSATPTSEFGEKERSPYLKGNSAHIIGPHGDYVVGIMDLVNAAGNMAGGLGDNSGGLVQALDWVSRNVPMYDARELAAFGFIYTTSAKLSDVLLHTMMSYASIPVNDVECGLSPSHLISRQMTHALSGEDGLPFLLEKMGATSFAVLHEAMATRSAARAHFNGSPERPATLCCWGRLTLEFWRIFDGAMQTALDFPIPKVKTLAALRAQFAHPQETFVPGLCPDGQRRKTPTVAPGTVPVPKGTAPAEAKIGWTSAEMQSLRKLHEVIGGWYGAVSQLEGITAASTPANQAHVRAAWSALGTAVIHFATAVAWISDVDPTTGAESTNRAAYVTSAVSEIRLMRAAFVEANTALTALASRTGCGGAACGGGEFPALANRGAAFSNSAIKAIDAMNLGLAYAEPHTGWYPHCFGPHGHCPAAILEMARAVTESATGYRGMSAVWCWVCNREPAYSEAELKAFSRTHLRVGSILLRMATLQLTLILVPSSTQTSLSPLDLVIRQFEPWLSRRSESQSRDHAAAGIPYHFSNWGIDTYVLVSEAMASRPVARAKFNAEWLRVTLTSWKHSDASASRAFEFPSEETLQRLRYNPSPLNDPDGPTILELTNRRR